MPKFRTLTGQFAAYIQDGPDPDITPDRLPMDGTVTFTPVYTGGVIAFPKLVPPEFARPEPIRAKIVGGETFVEVASGTEEPPTLQPLSLMVTVDDEATQTWSWRAEFSNMRVFGGNGELSIPAWSFRVPDGVGPVDLTELVPLKSGGSVDVTKGPRGAGLENITAVDGQLVFAYTDGAESIVPMPDAVQGPQGVPGPAGADGAEGPEGPQGPAGEIPDLLVGNITDATPTGKNLMLAATEGAARNALGLAAGATAINGSLTELNNGVSNNPRVWTASNLSDYTLTQINGVPDDIAGGITDTASDLYAAVVSTAGHAASTTAVYIAAGQFSGVQGATTEDINSTGLSSLTRTLSLGPSGTALHQTIVTVPNGWVQADIYIEWVHTETTLQSGGVTFRCTTGRPQPGQSWGSSFATVNTTANVEGIQSYTLQRSLVATQIPVSNENPLFLHAGRSGTATEDTFPAVVKVVGVKIARRI